MPLLRGAIPTPRHKLLSVIPHRAAPTPASFLVVPRQLSMWGNSTYGDCVSAEEAFAKAAWSTMLGLPETFIPEQQVISWASRNGYLNGADLTSVMDSMAASGMVASDGKTYTDGSYQGVDYMDDAALFSGIFAGASLKIGVAANQLEDAVNSTNGTSGWVGYNWSTDHNEDHCVGLCGFGTAADLAALFAKAGINISLPSAVPSNTPCAALYTWQTIGLVTLSSMRNITGEAYVRVPTTAQQPAPTPAPGPTPTPTPPAPTPTPPAPTPPAPTPTPAPPSGWSGTFLAGGPPWDHKTVTVSNGLIMIVQ